MADIPLKIYKVGGNAYDIGMGDRGQGIDPQELYQAYHSDPKIKQQVDFEIDRRGRDEPLIAQAYKQVIGGNFSNFETPYATDPRTGKPATKDFIAQEAMPKVGTPIQTPTGGVAYVPTGSYGAQNIPNLGTQNYATQANAPQPTSQSNASQGTSTTEKPPTTGFNWDGVNLMLGKKSDDVKELQVYLNGIGVVDSEGKQLKTDGIYGPKTLEAVKKWQSEHNLLADGVVGKNTVSALNSVQAGTFNSNTSGNIKLTPEQQAVYDKATGAGGTSSSGGTGAGGATDTTTTDTGEDPQITAWKNALTDQYKALYEPMMEWLKLQKEQGNVVRPDLDVSKLVPQFLAEAQKNLDPYYAELIRQNQQDLTIANQQLQTDYEKTIGREQPQFQQNLENQDITEANSGTAFSSGRVQRENQIITGQQNKLSDYFDTAQRGAEQNAIASERKIGSRAFSELGIPSLQQYAVQPRTIAPTGSFASSGSRSLYTPQGSLEGSLPIEQRTAVGTEVANLSEAERKKRILDANPLGGSSLG